MYLASPHFSQSQSSYQHWLTIGLVGGIFDHGLSLAGQD